MPQAGEVLVKNKPLAKVSRLELAREVALVAQETHFRFPFSVTEVVLMGRFPHLKALQFEGKRDMAVAFEAMKATHCLELAGRSIHEMGEPDQVITSANIESVYDCPVLVDTNPVTGRPRVNLF